VFLQSSMHVAFSFLSLFWFSSPLITLSFFFVVSIFVPLFVLVWFPLGELRGKQKRAGGNKVQRESLDPAISKKSFLPYIFVFPPSSHPYPACSADVYIL
jgi:hypothetical protein